MSASEMYPTLPGWTAYAEALGELQRLEAERADASRAWDDLRGGAHDAQKADDGAQAAAMRAGRPVPGRTHEKKWKAELETAATRARVLGEAVTQQQAVVDGLLRGEREQAIAAAQVEADAATDAYRDALAGILTSRERFWATKRTLDWLKVGVEQGRRLKVNAPGLAELANPEVRGGDPLPAATALAAFRNEVDPPVKVKGPDRYALRREDTLDSVTLRAIPMNEDGSRYEPDGQGAA
jgi:hypothetical protein